VPEDELGLGGWKQLKMDDWCTLLHKTIGLTNSTNIDTSFLQQVLGIFIDSYGEILIYAV
jgi:hypothetical protein